VSGIPTLNRICVMPLCKCASLCLTVPCHCFFSYFFWYVQTSHVAAQYGQTAFLQHICSKWNAEPDPWTTTGGRPSTGKKRVESAGLPSLYLNNRPQSKSTSRIALQKASVL